MLSGAERGAALRRVVAEPAFAAEVDSWRLRLAPLLDGIAEVPAPEGAWHGIERAIGQVAHVAVARWRTATFAATAVAAGLAVILVMRPATQVQMPAPQTAPMLAQVAGERGLTLVTAQYDAASGELRVRTSNMAPGDRVPELWVIAGDAAPRSLGIVAANGTSRYLAGTDLQRVLADGVTIAVTMEPRSDTPHAAPTGTVLGTAKLVAI